MTVIQQSDAYPTAGDLVSNFPYGRAPFYDAGTAGDVFVDGVNGLDTNTGLSPAQAVKTIAKGYTVVKAMSGARTMRIMGDGVKYRESVSTNFLNPFPTTPLTSLAVKSYGTDLPWVSGAERVTGFTACTVADEPLLGAAKWPNVYKATLSKSVITGHSSYWRMMLRENDVPLDLAQLRGATRIGRPVPKFFIDSSLSMMGNDTDATLSISLNGSNQLDKITHTSTLPSYTDAQLGQTVAAILVYPNFVEHIKVASVASGVLQLAANTRNFNGSTSYRYNLLNLLPEITQGGWGYRDNGDGTLTVYVWPNDPASLASGIEVAARGFAWKHDNDSRPIRFEGIGFEMCAADDTPTANAGQLLNLNLGDNKTVSQCHFRCMSGKQAWTLYEKWGSNNRIEYSTFEYGQGCYGAGFTGKASPLNTGNRLYNCLFDMLSFTPIRHSGQDGCATVYCRIRRTSGGGHANTYDHKGTIDRCVAVGLVADMSLGGRPYQGYATNQTASRIFYLHSTFPLADDGRAYVDQTISSDVVPTNNAYCGLINCWVPHEAGFTWPSYGAFNLGRSYTNATINWYVYNNVLPKIVSSGGTLDRKNNLLTSTQAVATGVGEEIATYTSVYTDPASRDWSAKAGGPIGSKAGYDLTGLIAQLEAWFPDVDFRKDAWGRAWDPANPGVGPWGSRWPAVPGMPVGSTV